MARPTTKADLLAAANDKEQKLWKLIDSMTLQEQQAVFSFPLEGKKEAHWARDQNLRDVLVHLYEWHQLLIDWIDSNQKGESKPFLPPPYNWKTYGDMNVMFFQKHQGTSLQEAKALLKESHQEATKRVEGFTDKELFENKHFSWTGTTSLGSYCTSATASHYDWAMKKVREQMKAKKG